MADTADKTGLFAPLREPSAGWGTPAILGLATALLSVLNPLSLVLVPLAFMLIAWPARKPWLPAVALLLLAWTFSGSGGGVLWWYSRGWALILGAWFVLAVALLPRATLMSRALLAVLGSASTVTLWFLVTRNGWSQLEWAVTRDLRDGAADVVAFWGIRAQGKPWLAEFASAINRVAEFQTRTYPALLGIGSLAGLALAWWIWRRLSLQDPRPLAPLREFRFRDELVWIVIIGAALIVLPLEHVATRAGTNLLTFMAALYALRGIAVLLALFGTPGIFGAVFGGLLFLMLYPIFMATTLMVGLSDTWLDLRARRLRQDDEKH